MNNKETKKTEGSGPALPAAPLLALIIISTNLLPELLKIRAQHIGRICRPTQWVSARRIVRCLLTRRLQWVGVIFCVVIPMTQEPLKASLADEWLNRKHSQAQRNDGLGVNLLRSVINVGAPVKFCFKLSHHSEESISSISSSSAPSHKKTNRASDAAANSGTENRAHKMSNHDIEYLAEWIGFPLGVLIVILCIMLWDEVSYWWWRLTEANDQAEPPGTKTSRPRMRN